MSVVCLGSWAFRSQYLFRYLALTLSASTIHEFLKLKLWPQDSKKRLARDSGRFLWSAMLSRKRRVGRALTVAQTPD